MIDAWLVDDQIPNGGERMDAVSIKKRLRVLNTKPTNARCDSPGLRGSGREGCAEAVEVLITCLKEKHQQSEKVPYEPHIVDVARKVGTISSNGIATFRLSRQTRAGSTRR